MLRYLRLYAYFLRFSFSKAMEFRVDFFFRIFMDTIYYAVNIAFFQIVFLHTGLLADWTESQVMVFVGAYLTVDALQMSFFASNMWYFPTYINKGDLDYYLTRPVSTLFFLSTREFAATSLVNLAMAIGILGWAINRLPQALTWDQVVVFTILILNGTFLYYLTQLLLTLPVFWTHSNRGLEGVFYNLGKFMERPDGIFKGSIRVVLTTLFPFALMASFPARVLFETSYGQWVWPIVIVTLLYFLLILSIWRMGLRSYSSASS